MSRRKKDRAADSTTPSAPSLDEAGSRRNLTVAAGALGILALVVYGNSFSAGLVFDNHALIATDPRVQSWAADTVKLIFTKEYWWPEITSQLYRPLTTLSYWANYTLLGGGTDVWGYHAVNFLLHWANTILVLLIVNRLGRRFVLAVLAAALFAVHPVNTEAVTNIIGRADLLATLTVLLGGWCYLQAAANDPPRRRVWLTAMGTVALLGVFMKETAIMIGGFALLYDVLWRWPEVKGDSFDARAAVARREFPPRYAFLLPAAAAFIVTRAVMSANSAVIAQFTDNPIAASSWFAGFMTAWKVVGRYLIALVFPRALASDYSYNQIPVYLESPSAWENAQAWVALAIVGAIVWFAWRLRQRQPILAWGILFLFVMQLPTSNLVVPIGSIMADRFLYLPVVGYAVAVACLIGRVGEWASGRVGGRGSEMVAYGFGALVVAALGVRTHVRNRDWHDELSLWRSALPVSPSSFRVHKAYASALLRNNQDEHTIDEAIASAQRGLAIVEDPPLPIERRDVGMFVDLGVYYRLKAQKLKERGQATPAFDFLRKSLDMLTRAREVDAWRNEASRTMRVANGDRPEDMADVGSAPVYHELGDTYLELGEFPLALSAARYAQRLLPEGSRGYMIEGVSEFYARRPDAAAVGITMALLLNPSRPQDWESLAACFSAMGQKTPYAIENGIYRFDVAHPLTAQLLSSASVALVRSFEAAKRPGDARVLQARLMREHGVPASAFSQPETPR